MALDKVLIGMRVREIRENLFGETRSIFAKRCNLTERHIGQIERGEYLVSLETLDKIATSTGVDADYILYGRKIYRIYVRKKVSRKHILIICK